MYKQKPEGDYYNNKEWYTDRNKQIYEDKMAGMSNTDLVVKYRVSPARIQHLIKRERASHEFKNTNVSKH